MTLKTIARTSGLIAATALLIAPFTGSNASLVFIAALPFVAVSVIIFAIYDI